jgi:hypothetical protein
MNAEETNKTIDRLIRARYPVIALISHEERRVMTAIEKIATLPRLYGSETAEPRVMLEWAISSGLQAVSPVGQDLAAKLSQMRQATIGNPPAVLKAIVDWPAETPAIFVLKDMHPFFNNAQVVRALRDAAYAITTRKQTIILLSPSLSVPPEMEKDIAVVDYPLPTTEEMLQIISDLEAEMEGKVRFNLNGDREPLARALSGLTKAEALAVLRQAIIAKGTRTSAGWST